MKLFNDERADVSKVGNLSLGDAFDDGAGHATYGYAKNDVWFSILPIELPAAIPTTSLTEANVRTAVGQYARSYTAGGAITPKLVIPLSRMLYRTFVQATGQLTRSNPHGFLVKDMYLSYFIATADATSIAVVATNEAAQSNNAARANASTTPLGTITYENPPGTTVGTLPVAQQANPYVTKIACGTPAFINTDRQNLTFEVQLSLPNTCVVTITEIAFHLAYAMY